MHPDHLESPFNAIPPVVLALAALIGGVELVFQAGRIGLIGGASGIGLRLDALNALAFSPRLFERMAEIGQFPPRQVLRGLSYSVLHLGFVHMAFVLVFLLALGKLVAETFAAWAVVLVWVVSSAVGALAYTLLLSTDQALVGGYPAVYGLIGAYTFILWTGLGALGQRRIRAFTLIALLLGIQLAFGLLFGGGPDWVADIAGFAAGFGLSFVVSPGGWRRVMEKIRQR